MVPKVSLRIDTSVKGDGRYPEFPAQSRDRYVPVHHGGLDRANLRLCQGWFSSALSSSRPHRRCTAGSACRRPHTRVPRRESRAPTRRTCRRRTGTWRSCETGSATAARRSTRRSGQVPRIGHREQRTRTGGCLPSPSPAGPRRAARAMSWSPARRRGARSSG